MAGALVTHNLDILELRVCTRIANVSFGEYEAALISVYLLCLDGIGDHHGGW